MATEMVMMMMMMIMRMMMMMMILAVCVFFHPHQNMVCGMRLKAYEAEETCT